MILLKIFALLLGALLLTALYFVYGLRFSKEKKLAILFSLPFFVVSLLIFLLSLFSSGFKTKPLQWLENSIEVVEQTHPHWRESEIEISGEAFSNQIKEFSKVFEGQNVVFRRLFQRYLEKALKTGKELSDFVAEASGSDNRLTAGELYNHSHLLFEGFLMKLVFNIRLALGFVYLIALVVFLVLPPLFKKERGKSGILFGDGI